MNITFLSGDLPASLIQSLRTFKENIYFVGDNKVCDLEYSQIVHGALTPASAEIPQEIYHSVWANTSDIYEAYSRQDVGCYQYKVQDCLRLLRLHVQFWIGHVEKFSPDLVLFVNLPHEGYDLVLSAVCDYFNIPQYSFFQCQYSPSFYVYGKSRQGWEPINKCFFSKQEQLTSIEKKNITAYNWIDDYISKLEGSKQFFYMVSSDYCVDTTSVSRVVRVKFVIKRLINIIKRISSRNRYEYALEYLEARLSILQVSLSELLYQTRSKKSTFKHRCLVENRRYIYFPLHLQPELTSSIMGGIFNDQAYALSLLSDICKSKNIIVLAKENPKQTHFHRFKKWFEDIYDLPNVYLVDSSIDTHQLTSGSLCVATISGTAGLEALARQKPVICLGNSSVWWKHFDGVYKFDEQTLADAGDFIDSLISPSQRAHRSPSDLRSQLLFDVAERCYDGCVDISYLKNFGLSETENNEMLKHELGSIINGIAARSVQ